MISNLRKATKSPKDDPRRAKAEPHERVRGSDLNEPGSAGTKGGGVALSATQESWLRSQVEDHNKRVSAKSKQARMEPLRKVYRRGMGAFSSTHHPSMSRDGWGRARVMHHLHLLEHGKPKNERYVQDNDLLPKGHPKMKKNNPLGMAATERHPAPYDVEESGPMTVRSGGPLTVRSEEAPPPATMRSTPTPPAPRELRLRCTVEEDMVPNRKPQVGDRVRRTNYGEVYARVDRPVTKAGYVPVVIEGRFPVNDRWPLKETEVVEMTPNRIGIEVGTHAIWSTGMADIPVVVENVRGGMVQVRDGSGALHSVSPMELALEHGREVSYAANHHLRAGQVAWLAYVGHRGGAIDKVKVLRALPGDEYVVQIGSTGATERIDGSVLFADKESAADACEQMEGNPYVRFAVQADWGDSEEKKEMESNRQGAGPYWVWTIAVGTDRPLVGEGPHGPHDLAGAKTYARIAATKGKHDRAVSLGRDPQARTFQVVRRYRAGDGERLI